MIKIQSFAGITAAIICLFFNAAIASAQDDSAEGIKILESTFAHGLTEYFEPVNPGNKFQRDETIYLSLKIKGRPTTGILSASFYFEDNFIARAEVDLSTLDYNSMQGLGQDIFSGFKLTHDEPFPISKGYHADIFFNNQYVTTYMFSVVPADDSLPEEIRMLTLAKAVNENYEPVGRTNRFKQNEKIFLLCQGDVGTGTWVQAEWYVGGVLDESGTRSLTFTENARDTSFTFWYSPEKGWPVGVHRVLLKLNGIVICNVPFIIE